MYMSLYVRNLSYGVTEDEFQQLLTEYGSVVNVNIIGDRHTGNSKGFGFVEMENKADAEKAVKDLDGSSVKGRNIKVNQARPRNEGYKSKRVNWYLTNRRT